MSMFYFIVPSNILSIVGLAEEVVAWNASSAGDVKNVAGVASKVNSLAQHAHEELGAGVFAVVEQQ
jgi:hypothetical protein